LIYLDHNATTPVLPEVREAMLPYLESEWGNPSSSYRFGSKLKGAIEKAREQVAELIGAKSPREILFTSGGTESNNTAIHAAVMAQPEKRHIVTSKVEHSSVLSYCRYLETHRGYRVTYLPVDREGLLSLSDLENALEDNTALVSLMWANNETGVLFPVEGISRVCRSRGIAFHCDAVQAAGKIPIPAREMSFDYLSITGHKLGAPKGIGALYVNKRAYFTPLLHGGHQERSRRGGTEAIPHIAGLGKAAELSRRRIPTTDAGLGNIRDSFEKEILSIVPNAERNGHKDWRLSNTSNIWFPGIQSEALLILLDHAGICASSGSACLVDSDTPSHVISAMKGESVASESIRFSFGLESNNIRVSEIVASIAAQLIKIQGGPSSLVADPRTRL